MNITNHKTNEVCLVKYCPCSNGSVKNGQVIGLVKDSIGLTKYVIDGNCTDLVECFPILTNNAKFSSFEDFKKNVDSIDRQTGWLTWRRILPP